MGRASEFIAMVNLGCKDRERLDDYIGYSRFCMAAMNYTVLINKEKLDRAYRLFDEDEDGGVTHEELKYILNFLDIMSDDEIKELLKIGDENDEISKDEFHELMIRFEKE
jgi:calcium-dependent protein kinase